MHLFSPKLFSLFPSFDSEIMTKKQSFSTEYKDIQRILSPDILRLKCAQNIQDKDERVKFEII